MAASKQSQDASEVIFAGGEARIVSPGGLLLLAMAAMQQQDTKQFFVIDTSTPESLERDFYAWLNRDMDVKCCPCSPLPPIERLCFRRDHSTGSPDEFLSDGASASPSSSISSHSSVENNADQAFLHQHLADIDDKDLVDTSSIYAMCPGRSSGTNQLGRTYSPGLPLSMCEREQIVQLYQGGWKICDISKRLCVTHSCVSKILNRFRTTGSVRPKDAKEGRVESPLVKAIRDYRFRLGMTRQSEIREQLIADGVCTRENAPSRSSINHILRTKLEMRKRKKTF